MLMLRRTLLLSMLLAWFAAAAPAETWTSFDVSGAQRTFATGINDGGDIVGAYVSEGVAHGYLYRLGVFTTIDPPGAIASHAVAINANEQIAGWFQTSDLVIHGFLFDTHGYTTLDVPGASTTVAQGIDNVGNVIGYYVSGETKGFRWNNGVFATVDAPGAIATELTGINNFHTLVGIYTDPQHKKHSYIQNGEGFSRKLPFKEGVFGINDHKVVVGSGTAGGLSYGFRYSLHAKKLIKMMYPGSVETHCFGINGESQIVGNYTNSTGKVRAFVRTP